MQQDQRSEELKLCRRCKKKLPKNAANFTIIRRLVDGVSPLYHSRCRPCVKEQDKEREFGRYRKIIDTTALREMRQELTECIICGATGKLSFDHCHTTNKPRGMLCTSCNHGLGKFRDDPELLEFAAEYLREIHDFYKGGT